MVDLSNGKDALYYSIAFSFALGENLANSTMLSGAGKLIDDARKIQSGFRSGNIGQAFKEVGSEFATSFIPTVVREGGKLFNDEHQKIAKEFSEYAKRNIAESDLEYDYDMRGRKFDKFAYFTQYEKDELDEELNSVFPRVTPIRNKISFSYDVFGNSVSIPLKSDEIRFLRKILVYILTETLEILLKETNTKTNQEEQLEKVLLEKRGKTLRKDQKKLC